MRAIVGSITLIRIDVIIVTEPFGGMRKRLTGFIDDGSVLNIC